jgi:hypothetical protein
MRHFLGVILSFFITFFLLSCADFLRDISIDFMGNVYGGFKSMGFYLILVVVEKLMKN